MTRYAIYYVPRSDSPLWRFGCAAVGYDSHTRSLIPFHDHEFYRQAEIPDWTADPRLYGFHATLKPPFRLAEGTRIEALDQAAEAFAQRTVGFGIPGLQVAALGSFLALVPSTVSEDLNRLAADCVRSFEPFRAPLTAADRERRLKSSLSPQQIENLDQWGYPYVFDEFRFHMTLTGRLPETAKDDAIAALKQLYAPCATAIEIDGIAICEQPDRDSRFFIRRRYSFGG